MEPCDELHCSQTIQISMKAVIQILNGLQYTQAYLVPHKFETGYSAQAVSLGRVSKVKEAPH